MLKSAWVMIVFFLCGCTIGRAAPPTPWPTATSFQSVQTTPVPTVARVASVIEQTPLPTATEIVCEPIQRPQHRVVANVDYTAKTVDVMQEITVPNQSGQVLDHLVLNVEPNRWLDAFVLNTLTIGASREDLAFDLTGRRLEVVLPEPLNSDCTVQLNLDYSLDLPPIIGGVEAFRGYFGFTERQMNLGHWLPTVLPYREGDWVQRESIFVGEQIVLDPADWVVAVNVANAPEDVIVAAPGSMMRSTQGSWRFEHRAGREFAISISHAFRLSQSTSESGVSVDVYTLPDALKPLEEGWIDGGEYAAEVTSESIDVYADRFGPFPHDRMVIVQGDFPDGMEFSGFAFVSTDWFNRYEGDPAEYLMLITVHEVAHQWWYDLVGNDQAQNPWLDEALSTYSEFIYIEAHYPDLRDWWWFFRVNRLNPDGYVDSSVYEFDAIRPYINAVYLRGVLMLHDLRRDLGDDAFFAWLTAYAETFSGDLATPADLWSLLTPEQQDATAFTRAAFLRQPGF